ncbi:unnamed protein product [Paramecium sonneborni]|uniref:Uncharacterized protein n=1 Tax=Paramecium sonneborni TaxID=65129 RepID=A0A8S1RB08_9CILI|nr:unnamed protein product [Paramecium sonneborni]
MIHLSTKSFKKLPQIISRLLLDLQTFQENLLTYLKEQIKHKVIILKNLSFFEFQVYLKIKNTLKIKRIIINYIFLILNNNQNQDSVCLINFIIQHSITVTNLLANQSGFFKDLVAQMIIETRHNSDICFVKSIYSLNQNKVNYLSSLKML